MKFLKKILPTIILSFILVWSFLIQFVFVSKFDQAKAAVAHWPQLSQPHLELSLALYQTSSEGFEKELNLAKLTLFQNQTLIKKVESIVNLPTQIEEQIKYWNLFSQMKIESAQANRHLSLLSWQKEDKKMAQDYFQKLFWLDPNSETTKQIGKIIKE